MPLEGSVKIVRDVVVCPAADDDALTVVSRTPAVRNAVMTLELVGPADTSSLAVRVVECRLIVIQGEVRHEIRFEPADASAAVATGDGRMADAGIREAAAR